MKILSYAAVGIGIIILINELLWIGKSSVAWVLIGLALSIILLGANQLLEKSS